MLLQDYINWIRIKSKWSVEDGIIIRSPNDTYININDSELWDDCQYKNPINRKGKDFYIYFNNKYILSHDGNKNIQKISGFHCLCNDVGYIINHSLSNYMIGDILPLSIWSDYHRPVSNPDGMVYNPYINKWIDIYFNGMINDKLVSKSGINYITVEDIKEDDKYNYDKTIELLENVNKDLMNYDEFISCSYGSNQGTNIINSVEPNDKLIDGYIDSENRRMISNIGCESMCGFLWQYVKKRERDNINNEGKPIVPILGGFWNSDFISGSRSFYLTNSEEYSFKVGIRGISLDK